MYLLNEDTHKRKRRRRRGSCNWMRLLPKTWFNINGVTSEQQGYNCMLGRGGREKVRLFRGVPWIQYKAGSAPTQSLHSASRLSRLIRTKCEPGFGGCPSGIYRIWEWHESEEGFFSAPGKCTKRDLRVGLLVLFSSSAFPRSTMS